MKGFEEIKVVFMGTHRFGALVLEGLIKNGLSPLLVVTAIDKPVGRKQIVTPPPVKVSAQQAGISILQPAKIKEAASEVKTAQPDLIIMAAYGQIVPKEILDIPEYGTLNVHPSLLPRLRGPSPVQSAILNGDDETGVTIMLTDDKMDHGPILSQVKTKILERETAEELHDRLAEAAVGILLETIPKWMAKSAKPGDQDEKLATYTKILAREDGRIDWNKPAQEIERKIRAFFPWPGAFSTFLDGKIVKKIKIIRAAVQKQTENGPFSEPGKTFLATNDKIAVQTGRDFLIIEDLQIEGKRKMSSKEFLRGNYNFIGKKLG